jgi:hypothetical protein
MSFLLEPEKWRWKALRWLVVMLIGVGGAGCGEQVVDAPPAKVAFESTLFRILDENVPPGTTLRQSYQNGAALVVMTDGARIRMRPSGKDWGDETAPGVGSVTVAEAGEHGVQNVGTGAFQLLALENLRPGAGSTGAPVVANGMTLAGESASFRVYDAQLAGNNPQISHVHSVPAVAILIKGKALTQGPENKDKAIGDVVSGLKQLDTPGQWVFVPAGETHYLVRLGTNPSQLVEVELR